MTLVQFSMKVFHYIQQISSPLDSFCPFTNFFRSPALLFSLYFTAQIQDVNALLDKTELIFLFQSIHFPDVNQTGKNQRKQICYN